MSEISYKELTKSFINLIKSDIYVRLHRLTGYERFWVKGYIALNKAGKFFK